MSLTVHSRLRKKWPKIGQFLLKLIKKIKFGKPISKKIIKLVIKRFGNDRFDSLRDEDSVDRNVVFDLSDDLLRPPNYNNEEDDIDDEILGVDYRQRRPNRFNIINDLLENNNNNNTNNNNMNVNDDNDTYNWV